MQKASRAGWVGLPGVTGFVAVWDSAGFETGRGTDRTNRVRSEWNGELDMSTESKSLTAAQHGSAIRTAHRAGMAGQFRAGLAVAAAVEAGMLTFARPEKGNPVPEGVWTRKSLADYLQCSPSLVSKYHGIGRLARLGIDQSHTDYTFAAESARAAWMTEALTAAEKAGDVAVVEKALADHRPGAQRGSGGANGKNTKKGTKQAARKTAAEKATDLTVTRANVEVLTAKVSRWLTANDGKRAATLDGESLESMLALLGEAWAAVEAAVIAKGGQVAKSA